MAQSHQPFTHIPPTHISPITCPYCGGMSTLTRCSPHPELKGELRTFECRDCGKTSTVTVPELAVSAFPGVFARIGSQQLQKKPMIVHAPPMTSAEPVASLINCPKCKREMALVGIESESEKRELYTFECENCDQIEVRGIRIT